MKITFSLALLAFSALALAQTPSQDDLLAQQIISSSPKGKYDAGVRLQGVFSLEDPLHCSHWAVEKIYELQARLNKKPNLVTVLNGADLVYDVKSPTASDPVSAHINVWSSRVQDMLEFLIKNNDDLPVGRHICLGMAKYPKPNAESMMWGFLIFDPQVFFDTNHDPDRTMFSMEAIAYHELAHQLQYWTDEPVLKDTFQGKPYARRSELQADCVSAALLTAKESRPLGRFWAEERMGIAAAVKAVGDIELREANHHGTPHERELAAYAGMNIVQNHLASTNGSTFGITSRFLLTHCRQAIAAYDNVYGNPWPVYAK